MSHFLSSFLGVEITIWHVVVIPIIIAIFKFLEVVVKKIIEVISNKEGQTINVYNDGEHHNDEHGGGGYPNLSQQQINETVRIVLKGHLQRIREEFGVDRVYIAKFHNGNDANEIYPGDIFQVYSIIEESLNVGISSEKRHLRDIPVTFYKSIIDPIMDNEAIIINNIEEINNSDLKYVFKNYGVKSLGGVGIFDIKENLIGVIFIEYVRKRKDIKEEHIDQLKSATPYYMDHVKQYKIKKGKKV